MIEVNQRCAKRLLEGVGHFGDGAPWSPYFENFKIHKFQFHKILKTNTHVCKDVKCMCENFQDEIP